MAERGKQTTTGKLLGLIRDGKDGRKEHSSRLLVIDEDGNRDLPLDDQSPHFCEIDRADAELTKVKAQFDAIWSNIILTHAKAPASILITAAALGEGVSYVAERLALYLACVYDLNVLYANLADETSKEAETSTCVHVNMLFEALSTKKGLSRLIAPTSVPALSILSLCKVRGKEAQPWLLPQHNFMQNILDYSRENFDVVVLDAQPVLQAPWTVSLAKPVECNLLVNRFAVTRREVMNTVLEAFQAGEVEIDGVILNDRRYCVPKNLYNLLK